MEEQKPDATVLEFPKEVALGAEVIGKRYEYEGKPGMIKVDGVEVAVETLTESEKIDAGEQILKRVSITAGTPVSELRKQLVDFAKKAQDAAMTGLVGAKKGPTPTDDPDKPKPQLRMVQTSGGMRPMLTNATSENRKDRRSARAKARKPVRLR